MSRRTAVILAALLAALIGAPVASAGSLTPISKTDWQQAALGFEWRSDAVPPAWMREAVLDAAGDSNRSRGSGAPSLAYVAGGEGWVAYTADLPDPTALAYASRSVPLRFKVWLRPHGYTFDWGKVRWCQFFDVAPDGCFDARMVALHELGHVLGLGHIEDAADPGPWTDSIMHVTSRAKPKKGWDAHDFGPCDVGALQVRYELLDPATPVSSCLSLATTLTLSASRTALEPGGSVTFTAALHIADGVPHPRLAGDPLNGRRVELQRRMSGTTSWTSVAVMAATASAGGYRLVVSPSQTYEWRALLSQPDEGLLGGASSMLKVTVSGGCSPYCVE